MNAEKYSDVATDLMLARAEVSHLRKLYKQIVDFKEAHNGEVVYLITDSQLDEIISAVEAEDDTYLNFLLNKVEVLE